MPSIERNKARVTEIKAKFDEARDWVRNAYDDGEGDVSRGSRDRYLGYIRDIEAAAAEAGTSTVRAVQAWEAALTELRRKAIALSQAPGGAGEYCTGGLNDFLHDLGLPMWDAGEAATEWWQQGRGLNAEQQQNLNQQVTLTSGFFNNATNAHVGLNLAGATIVPCLTEGEPGETILKIAVDISNIDPRLRDPGDPGYIPISVTLNGDEIFNE